MNVKLIKLSKEYEQQLGEMVEEFKDDIKKNGTEDTPYVIFKNDYHDFDYYLNHLEVKNPTNGLVPDSVFFLLNEDNNRLLGAVNIRHALNDHLLQFGGHIGEGIRPSERGKGYANKIIELALQECKKLGIDKVLMTCYKTNIPSIKVILKNGGVLENEVMDDGKVLQRYWINN